ncbi:MAG: ATP-binding region ATPase protein [uncultured bacterium]|nr:MAG: ATP-binding region ATPase protein [uncultured bacterium]
MNDMKKIILLVEDEDAHALLIEHSMKKYADKYQIKRVSNITQARDFLNKDFCDIVISDLYLSDGSGIALVDVNKPDKIPLIVMSSLDDKEKADEMLKMGAKEFIVKSSKNFRIFPEIIEKVLQS